MKDFEDYECEGQITLEEYFNSNFPKDCCGVTPWLHKTKCCRWDIAKPQTYTMYYICPKCMKTPVDNTGWIIYEHGTKEEAEASALRTWNDPNTIFEIKDFNKNDYIDISFSEYDLWEEMYGQSYEEYRKPILDRLNEEFRKKHKGDNKNV